MASTPDATATRLENVALDNGFDLELPRHGDWLGFASSKAPLRLWLTAVDDSTFIAAMSQSNVARALGGGAPPASAPVPPGACASCAATSIHDLHAIVRRAFQLSKTLPNELLRTFEKKIAGLPRATDVERLVVQRVGQDVFRAGLIEYWEGRCAITGLGVVELLRASHIKPWADCEIDAERLDVFNGLLLAPQYDAAFDRGYITVADDGAVMVAADLTADDREVLGLDRPRRVAATAEGHHGYLAWHRERVFRHSTS